MVAGLIWLGTLTSSPFSRGSVTRSHLAIATRDQMNPAGRKPSCEVPSVFWTCLIGFRITCWVAVVDQALVVVLGGSRLS